MQEPVSKNELLQKNSLDQSIQRTSSDKDSNSNTKKLENKIQELEIKNEELEKRIQGFEDDSSENSKYHKIMAEYEEFISKIVEESQKISEQKSNLESYATALSEKYEKAKTVIDQYQSNEELLKQKLTDYEEQIQNLMGQYNNLSEQYQITLTNATLEMERASKENIQQVVNLKQLLRKKQATINQLQKSYPMERKYSNSMFKPLKGL